jgi:hypothetical protein
MATRKVILTERELTSLIKKIIKETEEMSDISSGDKDFGGGKFSWIKRAAREVAQLFKNEVMPEIDEDELNELKGMARELDPKSALSELPQFVKSEEGEEALSRIEENFLYESIIKEGLSDRMLRKLAKSGVITGIGMVSSGFLSFASMLKGYIDFKFLAKVHEIIDPYCSAFCGPLSFLVMVLGVLIALGSASVGHRFSKD